MLFEEKNLPVLQHQSMRIERETEKGKAKGEKTREREVERIHKHDNNSFLSLSLLCIHLLEDNLQSRQLKSIDLFDDVCQ